MKRRRTPNEAIYFREQIEDAAARFRQQVDASRTLVADLTPLDILTPHEGSRVLAELVNKPGRAPWEGATGSGMNWRLATSELEAERRHLRLDGEPVILYSLLSPPARATANLLHDLYRLDSVMTVSLEWRPWDLDAARRKIRGAQRHYFSKRYSMMAHVQETEGTASAMVDSAADVESGRLGDALVELETQGDRVRRSRAHHCPPRRAGADRTPGRRHVLRIFAAHDAKAIREGYGQLPAWFCRLPAQPRKRQVRSVFVSAGAAACLAPIYGPPTGEARSPHLDRAALAILETQWQTPFHYDLFHGDVGHTLVLGATGAGKSFTLNFLLVQALQYNPRVLILDLGGSYRWITRFLGGGYLELSPDDATGAGRVSTAALCAAPHRAEPPIPHRLDHAVAPDRRLDRQRVGPVRNPRAHRRPLRLPAGPPDDDRLCPLLAGRHVAGDGALVRQRRLGAVFRQRGRW